MQTQKIMLKLAKAFNRPLQSYFLWYFEGGYQQLNVACKAQDTNVT